MGAHERPAGASDAVPVSPVRVDAVAAPASPFTTVAPSVSPPRWDQPRAQRVRSSAVTFGPVGRLVLTGVILLFLAWIVVVNTFFAIPAVPAVVWALKDTWKKAPERRAPLPTGLVDNVRYAGRDPGSSVAPEVVAFDGRVPPAAGATAPE